MLRRIQLLICFSLIATCLTYQANAAVKAGTSCSRLNAIAIVSGLKYTCQKSGKKLVWSKGKKLPVINPNPKVTPQPVPSPASTSISPTSPTPEPTPTPLIEDDSVIISRGIVYQYLNGKLERQATSGKYFVKDSRDSSTFDPIRVKAYEQIRAKITTAGSPNFTFVWDIKPGFPSDLASFLKDYSEKAASFWGWVFSEPLVVPAQLVTEKDLEWQKKQELAFSDTVDILTIFTTDNFKMQKSWIGGGGHLWYRSSNDPKLYSLLSYQTPSYAVTSNMKGDWVMVPAHEVSHIIQDYYRKGITETNITSYDLRANGTFQEGSVTLFGYAIALDHLGWYSDGLDEFLYSNFKNDKYWKPVNSVEDVIKILEATEARTNNSTHQSSYSIGALLYEWVIAKYGFESYIRILENLPNNADFSDTIKKSLGISKSELYKNVAPYILESFKRIKL